MKVVVPLALAVPPPTACSLIASTIGISRAMAVTR
jgi:hypothetical protein